MPKVCPRQTHSNSLQPTQHGRGIYIANASILEELSDSVLAKDVHVFPPTNGVMLRREFSRGYPGWR